MASNGKATTEVYGRWKVMTVNLQPQLDKLPQLTGQYTQLAKMTADADVLETRQAQLTADLQEVNRQRRDLLKSGEDLRNRIGAALRAEHGFTSERLLEFGLKPRRPRGRAKKTPPAATTTTPTSTTPTTTAK
jgi:hypothetical protein